MNQEMMELGASILVVLVCAVFWWWWKWPQIKRAQEEPRPEWSRSPEWDEEKEK